MKSPWFIALALALASPLAAQTPVRPGDTVRVVVPACAAGDVIRLRWQGPNDFRRVTGSPVGPFVCAAVTPSVDTVIVTPKDTTPPVVLPPVNLGDIPQYDATNPNHVLHVFEDWSTYTSPSQITSTNRVDGGGPWVDDTPGFQSFTTANLDPWFGRKVLTIDNRAVAPEGQSYGHGLNLVEDIPSLTGNRTRYRNAAQAKESIVLEWAWRWEGGPYVGKILDWQPYPGTDRFNYQSGRDRLGAQVGNTCDNDPLCSKYYSSGGSVPRFPGLLPSSTGRGGTIARSEGSVTTFYVQNRGYPQVNWGGTSDATHGINLADNTWRRTILRLTLNADGVMGRGRFEEWLQKAGEAPVKVMEYVGDVGGFDEGLVRSRIDALGGRTWLYGGATLHLYNLTAVSGIFDGGNLTHLGYVRIWSEPRP